MDCATTTTCTTTRYLRGAETESRNGNSRCGEHCEICLVSVYFRRRQIEEGGYRENCNFFLKINSIQLGSAIRSTQIGW